MGALNIPFPRSVAEMVCAFHCPLLTFRFKSVIGIMTVQHEQVFSDFTIQNFHLGFEKRFSGNLKKLDWTQPLTQRTLQTLIWQLCPFNLVMPINQI